MRDFAKVSPRYWTGRLAQHIRESDSPADAHAVAFYLLTNNHANMIGLYRCPLSYIVEDTGCPIEGASKGLDVLEQGAFLVYRASTGHVWIRNALRLELTGKSGTFEGLKLGDKRLPSVRKTAQEFVAFQIYQEFYEFYCGLLGEFLPEPASPIEGASKPHGKPHRRTEQEQEQEQETEQEQEVSPELPADGDSGPPPVAIWIPIKAGKMAAPKGVQVRGENGSAEAGITRAQVEEYGESYGMEPKAVFAELKKARQWCIANPVKQKTPRGIMSFVNRWMDKAANSTGSPGSTFEPRKIKGPTYKDLTRR